MWRHHRVLSSSPGRNACLQVFICKCKWHSSQAANQGSTWQRDSLPWEYGSCRLRHRQGNESTGQKRPAGLREVPGCMIRMQQLPSALPRVPNYNQLTLTFQHCPGNVPIRERLRYKIKSPGLLQAQLTSPALALIVSPDLVSVYIYMEFTRSSLHGCCTTLISCSVPEGKSLRSCCSMHALPLRCEARLCCVVTTKGILACM